jgi:hypothetical protein
MQLVQDFVFAGYGATSPGESDGVNHLKIDDRWKALDVDADPWRELFLSSVATRRCLRDLRGRASSYGGDYEFFWWVAWLRSDTPLDVSVVRPEPEGA